MANDLATLRDRVEQILDDAANAKWDTNALDEAIRQALHAYSEHLPRRAIAALTLTAAGREIDLSSLAPYRTIERVWWDYDEDSPDHPPRWRDFELWPGHVLYIDDAGEPAAGDVVRLWYTLDHTLEDLDTATATTFPDPHATLIAQGATGFAAVSRNVTVQEQVNVNAWAPRNLREWAETQLRRFYATLDALARRQAALSAGLAPLPPLDRWDNTS